MNLLVSHIMIPTACPAESLPTLEAVRIPLSTAILNTPSPTRSSRKHRSHRDGRSSPFQRIPTPTRSRGANKRRRYVPPEDGFPPENIVDWKWYRVPQVRPRSLILAPKTYFHISYISRSGFSLSYLCRKRHRLFAISPP